MRVKRKTKVRKYLRYYRTVHGFREPYKILLDGNFVSACVARKLDDSAAHHVTKFLSANPSTCKIFTTRAVRKELETMRGEDFAEAANQTHKLLLVNENENPSGGGGGGGRDDATMKKNTKKNNRSSGYIENVKESILDACKEDNRERFIVCTQDGALKKQLRKESAKVPIIFCHVSGLQMEPPVDADSKSGFAGQTEKNEGVSEKEMRALLTEREGGEEETRSMYDVKTNVRYKMKKTKGPNPLSNLKKKKRGGPDGLSAPDVSSPGGGKKKRKRR